MAEGVVLAQDSITILSQNPDIFVLLAQDFTI